MFKHPEYEYVLFIQVGSACPYLSNDLSPYRSMEQVERVIKEIEKKHSRAYNGTYYIDNDFYENPYPLLPNGTYYKFLRRKVNDWESFSTKEDNVIHLDFRNKNVIKRIK